MSVENLRYMKEKPSLLLKSIEAQNVYGNQDARNKGLPRD
jgi:hypothetical protein